MGDDAAELALGLAGLQDVLGELHDTAVAEAWLRGVLPSLAPHERFAAGEMVGRRTCAWPASCGPRGRRRGRPATARR